MEMAGARKLPMKVRPLRVTGGAPSAIEIMEAPFEGCCNRRPYKLKGLRSKTAPAASEVEMMTSLALKLWSNVKSA